jgi:hypothetical protein
VRKTASSGPDGDGSAAVGLVSGYISSVVDVNGISLHYLRGGSGPTLLLIHGFPQDWYE